MPNYAHFSPDATRLLAEKTGNPRLQVFVRIDPQDSRSSFFLIPYPDKIMHVPFADLTYDPLRFDSLVEALYGAIYEA
ncbi:hypothetical protein SD70_25935 [Gordoniibacillus kamchatkensis]|uniref:Uncharacterized protein n=1 Tax=Gordoniibacillus kamchatkensis TaxID=1590651 RepID=A0ABR5ABQ3_9BACL|nr:hypothetical protein [Paenibacillus sp. VKM B-2647]KIL38486.1 hypothetical protein SD70_25935 [Paenibacillus sp. VKM B-2647]